MPAKVCPRCGAQYQNLRSKTCPQCFAVLVSVDDATAEELAAARTQVEESPEFQQVKAEDDERFKEQSFGACLGVIAMTAVTLILAVVLIAAAARHHSKASIAPPTPALQGVQENPLTTLPVAAAELSDVMPSQIGAWRLTASDQNLILPGTLTHINHAVYQEGGGGTLDAYAIPAGRLTAEQNQFRLGLTLAAQMQRQAAPVFFATEYWHYASVSSPGKGEEFERALADYFRAKGR